MASKYHSIGMKLILAFTAMTILITIVSLISFATWNKLDKHVENILITNVPKYNSSYQLESASFRIDSVSDQLSKAKNKYELEQLHNVITKELITIHKALNQLDSIAEVKELRNGYNALEINIEELYTSISLLMDSERELNHIEKKVDWLHQDIYWELQPLYQEMLWQLSRKSSEQDTSQIIENVFAIQELMEKEQELYALIEKLSLAYSPSQLSNGMTVVQYQLEELTIQSNKIASISSAVTFLQLLSDYSELLLPGKSLNIAFLKRLKLDQAVVQSREKIHHLLKTQHELIHSLVNEADGHFATLKINTSELVSYGNNILLFCFSFSILTSLFLTSYFIKNKIVGRLITLSHNLDSIGRGRWNTHISLHGKDEISVINQKLSSFANQMKELERTNALNLLNNTQASIITCELNGCIESVNNSAKHLFSKDSNPITSPLWGWFPKQHRSQIKSLFAANSHLHKRGHDSISITFGSDASPSFLKLELHQYLQGNTTRVIVTITDITEQIETTHKLEKRVAEKTLSLQEANAELVLEVEERKRTEKNLKMTQEELVHAAKMAVLGQTMTSLAHELNQPLSAISAYLYSAQFAAANSDPNNLTKSLAKIEELTSRMSKIINNLRQFSRKTPGDTSQTTVNLFEAVEKAAEMVQSKMKQQQITLNTSVPKHLSTCADAVQIEQVLINLLVNACDAVSEAENSKMKWVEIRGHITIENTIFISVSDSGNGFAHEVVDKVFTPFTTTKEVGLGLGLMISQSLISRFNGTLYLASNLNGGAMVILELENNAC